MIQKEKKVNNEKIIINNVKESVELFKQRNNNNDSDNESNENDNNSDNKVKNYSSGNVLKKIKKFMLA